MREGVVENSHGEGGRLLEDASGSPETFEVFRGWGIITVIANYITNKFIGNDTIESQIGGWGREGGRERGVRARKRRLNACLIAHVL